jgi:hypothetical protein
MLIHRWIRNRLIGLARRVLLSDEGRDLLLSVNNRYHVANDVLGAIQRNVPCESYADVPGPEAQSPLTCPIFITGRFRSGSTLLWNIFRQLPAYTAYYEPLNERRWFDRAARGAHTDETHRRVDDYWREYDALSDLSGDYREDWIRRDLLMTTSHWDPALRRYIDALIDRAEGQAVLQFNRVDFRLPWLKAAYPHARIIHLFRHPRDQWVSTLHGEQFPIDGDLSAFANADKFYLMMWARDLKKYFPFLDDNQQCHPYRIFYWIWKLSYLFGRTYSNASIAFESLVQHPRQALEQLFATLQICVDDYDPLLSVVERPHLGRWREYASEKWFRCHELECERVLTQFFSMRCGEKEWRDIKMNLLLGIAPDSEPCPLMEVSA